LLASIPRELSESISQWPERWLPVLRRQLTAGDQPNAHTAALLLDEHGAISDIGLLRAFDKTYRKRSRAGLGRALARRVSPKLSIRDLGRVTLAIGERQVKLSRIRRKPASLLMYLVTRPRHTATREQVLDELWPDHDPTGAANSLNQSLYFIRREIDPWYEDDVSPDYLCYEAEILWLDPGLTRVASSDFISDSAALLRSHYSVHDALAMTERYLGQFSPEFEYEEWAIAWRTRVHASFLSFATRAIDDLAARGDLSGALQLAQRSLAVDPTADDIERKMIRLYWHAGARSAAVAQYRRLAATYAADGLDPPSLPEITGPGKH
jgi:DNA-binding SARP family transcriptional activator